MRNMLYKEFHLIIHPLFYAVLLFGALLLIPQWVYLLAFMYFTFITVPNIFTIGKAHNDIGFSAMLPIRRSDIVKARVLSIALLEVLQILAAIPFAVINLMIYPERNFLLDTNVTFFGAVFLMYGIFNIVFFPMFYKTAYKVGIPVIAAITAALLLATGVELILLFVPELKVLDGTQDIAVQLPALAAGIIAFVLLSLAAFKLSAKRFIKIDL